MAVYTWVLTGNASGTWTNNANWSPNTGWPASSADQAFFGSAGYDITQNSTVTLDTTYTLDDITFADNGGSGFAWTITGGGIISPNTSANWTTTTNATITNVLGGNSSFNKQGAATLTLTGGGAYGGILSVRAGTLTVTTNDFTVTGGGLRVYGDVGATTVTLNSGWRKGVNYTGGNTTLNISPVAGKTVEMGALWTGHNTFGTGNSIVNFTGPGNFVYLSSATAPDIIFGYTANTYTAVFHTGGDWDIQRNNVNENIYFGFATPAAYYGTGGTITRSSAVASTWASSLRVGPSVNTSSAVVVFNGTTLNIPTTAFGQSNNVNRFASYLVSFRQGTHNIGTYGLSDSTAVTSDIGASFKLAIEGNGTPNSTTVNIGTLSATADLYNSNYSHVALTKGGRLYTTTYTTSGSVPRYFSMVDGGEFAMSNGMSFADNITLYGPTSNKFIVGSGSTATISSILSSATGSGITSVTGSGLSGFAGAPHLSVAAPASGVPAMVRATYSSPTSVSVDVIVPGTGYTTAPTITATGGGASIAGTFTAAAPVANTAGGIEKTDAGTLILTGANTYTGTTTISGGTLNVGNNTAVGTPGAATSPITMSAGTTLEWARTAAYTQSGVLTSPATATLRRMGTSAGAALTLSGNNSAFDGAITIDADNGVSATTSANSLGGTVAGSYGNITINSGGFLQIAGVTSYKNINVSGSGYSSGGAIISSGTSNLYGNISLGSDVTVTTNGNTYYRGVISGSFGITKGGNNALNLSAVNNTFTGNLTLNSAFFGAALLRNSSVICSIGTGSTISIANGATLSRNQGYYTSASNRTVAFTGTATGGTVGFDAASSATYSYIGSLGFNGTFTGPAATGITKTLSLTGSSPANCIAAALTNSLAGTSSTLTVTKSASGTYVFSNPLNNYSGGTTVSAGMLAAAAEDGTARFGAGAVTLSNSGTRIQALTGITQKGRHTYSNNLTFNANTGVRIGGAVGALASLTTRYRCQPIRLGGTLTLPASGTTTWDLSKDPVFTPNASAGNVFTHTLFEFDPGVATPVSGTLATAVTVVPPTGWTAGVPTLTSEVVGTAPAFITITLTKT